VRNISLREKLIRMHLATKSTRKFQTDDEISLQERFSRASSYINDENNSASYNSLNSITTILSHDNLNLFNMNQTKLMTAARLEQPNIILNYSLYFDARKKSLIINIISLEHVQMPASLTGSSNSDLNIYVKLEILPPKEVTMGSISMSSQASLVPHPPLPKISAKTRVIRHKSSPIYNETFELENLSFIYDQLLESEAAVTADTVVNLFKCYRLVFNVCNSNLFGRDQIIGQTVHNLLREDCFMSSEYYRRIMVDTAAGGKEENASAQPKQQMLTDPSTFSRIYSKKVDLVVDTRVSFELLFYFRTGTLLSDQVCRLIELKCGLIHRLTWYRSNCVPFKLNV
jgi:hypothetical protein